MASWTTEAYAKSINELNQYRQCGSLQLFTLLKRFVMDDGRREEFLHWAAKDMGIDKPMDLTDLTEAIGGDGQGSP